MNENPLITELKGKMQKAIAVISEDLATIRTGRATPALVENIVISAYNGAQNLRVKEMATITTDGPRMILIAPFDPTVTRDIEKGINSQNLGFSASVDSNIIRISIPPLTADRRAEFVKLANTKIEGGKVMIRQNRHDAMSSLKKTIEANEISEDEKKRLEREVQEITDEMIAELDVLRDKKEEELKQV